MGKIKILDESVSNIIAAGEVVENPASMIKELIENSLDAEASSIKIYVNSNGRYVKLIDNGTGMGKEDLFLSIERHATSKISHKEDIFNLHTYGFRGEALASIASVSKLKLSSRIIDNKTGVSLSINAGRILSVSDIAMSIGTEIEVDGLFFNTPARLKFLRSQGTEYSKIKNVVLTEALANYNCSFTLNLDGKDVVKTSGKGVKNCILELFGANVLKNLKEFELGFVGNLNILKGSKDNIFTYINGRYVKSLIIEKAVIDSYYTKLMKGKYPFAIIFLEIDSKEIDVNVHPSKKIVKFSNETKVYSYVKNIVDKALAFEEREDLPILNDFYEEKIEEIPQYIKEKVEYKRENQIFSKNIEEKVIFEEKSQYNSYKDEIKVTDKQVLPGVATVIEYKTEVKVEEEVDEIKNELNYRIIGQLNNMYILVERDNELEIYDQHIVHERILYEELKEQHLNKKISVQNLLVPIKIEVSLKEKDLIENNLEILKEYGFELDEFGEKEYLIRTAPIFDFRESVKETFYYILDKVEVEDYRDFREKILISMSCKNAIKAHEPLNNKEIKILLDKLHYYGKYTCPHGRPIIIKLPFDKLDKMFGRK
ncbi:MAG: DNA mismatch repair endonuclease MutL [Fusobacteriaceae bacterium]|nr:DNA mismatch repair endonuclease MutL [Fusobacteriaceae bacterium]MBN2838733.1 DNA mismatch repair endonuclease MutL [Fusobacteriaceae bacterium]